MLSGAERALLDLIRSARQEGRLLDASEEPGGVDLDGAYRVQAALLEGQELRGYKLGLISPAKQAQMGIDEPIYGRVTAGMLLESPVPLGRFRQPRIEPELAVVLREDLPPEATPGAARLAVDAAFLAIDILDSVWQGYRFSLAGVVADNASGGGFLLGERALPLQLEGELRLYLDGELLAEGPLGSLGNPEERLCWLARATGGLRSGQVVFLGAPAAAVPARPGVLEVHGPEGSVLLARLEP